MQGRHTYQPSHPDAQENGHIAYPNEEKAGLIKAQNACYLVIANMPVKPVDLLVGENLRNALKTINILKSNSTRIE